MPTVAATPLLDPAQACPPALRFPLSGAISGGRLQRSDVGQHLRNRLPVDAVMAEFVAGAHPPEFDVTLEQTARIRATRNLTLTEVERMGAPGRLAGTGGTFHPAQCRLRLARRFPRAWHTALAGT